MQYKKILIIDDNNGIRALLREFLILNGFEAHSANSGISALQLLENNYFDIIITDYSMPGMNGVELTKTVRSLHPHVLIIGMSANRNEKDFLEAGAHAFLLKPLQLQELLSACRA